MANSKLTAGAGEHYIAYVLSCFDYVAALVREGSPTIDLLASNVDGSRTIGVQVKTTEYAVRTRGRGKNKRPHEIQFPLGHKAIENAVPDLIFCFVDLRTRNPDERPDVYVIPANTLIEYYKDTDIRNIPYFRLHWPIESMEIYKNNWDPIHRALGSSELKT